MFKHLWLLLVLLTVAPCALADNEWTGNDLLSFCAPAVRQLDGEKNLSMKDLANIGTCYGYITGYNLGVLITTGLNTNLKAMKAPMCPGAGTTVGQSARVLVKFLKENPEQLNKAAGSFMYAALSSAYPCK